MTKNINKVQIFRYILQVVLFFSLPGMYILSFNELKSVVEMISKGNFNFIQAFPGIMESTVTIIFTILLGRFFCGWFCAFGTFNDWVYTISKKFFKIDFKINERLDSILKYVKYLILFSILILTFKGGRTLLNAWSPWNAFAQISDFSTVISSMTIGFTFLVVIVIGNIFVERFFCRYLCPLGALFSLISKASILKVDKPNSKCGKCRICTNNCSMGLKLYNKNSVRGGDCINCLKCIEVCPRKNPHVNILNKYTSSAMASSFAIVVFIGLYSLTNFGNSIISGNGLASTKGIISNSTNSTISGLNTSQKTEYKDGTYVGSGTGFNGGTTKVSVTINGGKIVAIRTVSTEDTPRFYQYVENTVPPEIISAQSTSVDTVSGATYSSRGLIEAIQNALNKAAL
ncbi:4Fe-4S binding protein [Clostridium sp. LBM24168]